ncbi:hypothetical protein RN001_014006 [Aquatica leii]|uniref:MADF domain-containing protein n=1 Tax=Aquatica leii TaxID=1421715 RepID=A0AAN7P3L1_9COLE|nr:hypothetical protein RN001_014006 [Aquatica leii]
MMSNRSYSNQLRRDNIWREIGKHLNESADACKQRWKTLRDCFQRAAKDTTKSGQAAKATRKWRFWNTMSFLLPYVKSRETHSNIEEEKEDKDREEGNLNDTQDELTQENNDMHIEENAEENNDQNHDEYNEYDSTQDTLSPGSCDNSRETTPLPHPFAYSSTTSSKLRPARHKTKNFTPTTTETLPQILKEYITDKAKSCRKRGSIKTEI